MRPCSRRNSDVWKPSGNSIRTVFQMTRGPENPISALGSAALGLWQGGSLDSELVVGDAFSSAVPLLIACAIGALAYVVVHRRPKERPYGLLALPTAVQLLGLAFGLTWTSRGLVSLPSPYLGGLLWDRFGPRTPFLATIFGCLLLSFLAFLKLKPPEKAPPAAV